MIEAAFVPPAGFSHFVCVLVNGGKLLPFRTAQDGPVNRSYTDALRDGIHLIETEARKLAPDGSSRGANPVSEIAVFRTWDDPLASSSMVSVLRQSRVQLVHVSPSKEHQYYAPEEQVDSAVASAAATWIASMRDRFSRPRLDVVTVGVSSRQLESLTGEDIRHFPLKVSLGSPVTSCDALEEGVVRVLALNGTPWKPRTTGADS